MLTDKVKGMQKDEIKLLSRADMDALYGVEVGPQREKCAMLALSTLLSAIDRPIPPLA
jgi:NifU-like protein involved in Fe-S cluster formation